MVVHLEFIAAVAAYAIKINKSSTPKSLRKITKKIFQLTANVTHDQIKCSRKNTEKKKKKGIEGEGQEEAEMKKIS